MSNKGTRPLTEGSTKGGSKQPSGKSRPPGKPPSQKPPLGDDIERQLEETQKGGVEIGIKAADGINRIGELERQLAESKKDREKLMAIICNAMSAIACVDYERSMVMLPEFLEGDLRKFIGDVKAQDAKLRKALETIRAICPNSFDSPGATIESYRLADVALAGNGGQEK